MRDWKDFRTSGENSPEAVDLLHEIGILHSGSGELELAAEVFQRGLEAARHSGDRLSTARALEALGMIRVRQKDYPSALDCFSRSLREVEGLDDRVAEAISWLEISAIQTEAGQTDEAITAIGRALERCDGIDAPDLQSHVRLSLASLLAARREHANAREHAAVALALTELNHDEAGVVESLLLLACIDHQAGFLLEADGTASRALMLAQRRSDARQIAAAHLVLAEVRADRGMVLQALELVKRGLLHAGRADNLPVACALHEVASTLYETVGNPRAALEHHRMFSDTRERQYRQLGQEHLQESGAALELRTLRAELEGSRCQSEILRHELAERELELTNLTLNLVQKSELLQDVREQLVGMVDSSSELTETFVHPLLVDLASETRADGSWVTFEQQFDHVHHEFLRRLGESFPLLTPMELKVCMLTKLDLSTKEIANLLHVSVRNVQNHRYRLRKKLRLTQEVNLSTFLATL